MKPYNGYKAERSGGREHLPAGGYVCQITGAREEHYTWGSVLIVGIDVAEGDYAGFWKRDYMQSTETPKKWRGTFRVNVPKDDGSEKDAWTKRTFNNFIWAVEASNAGYAWDWNEAGLKGMKVGIIYREKEWEMNGNTGWTTEAGGAESIDNIRSGSFKQLKPKSLKKDYAAEPAGQYGTGSFAEIDGDPDDLPF